MLHRDRAESPSGLDRRKKGIEAAAGLCLLENLSLPGRWLKLPDSAHWSQSPSPNRHKQTPNHQAEARTDLPPSKQLNHSAHAQSGNLSLNRDVVSLDIARLVTAKHTIRTCCGPSRPDSSPKPCLEPHNRSYTYANSRGFHHSRCVHRREKNREGAER